MENVSDPSIVAYDGERGGIEAETVGCDEEVDRSAEVDPILCVAQRIDRWQWSGRNKLGFLWLRGRS